MAAKGAEASRRNCQDRGWLHDREACCGCARSSTRLVFPLGPLIPFLMGKESYGVDRGAESGLDGESSILLVENSGQSLDGSSN